MIRIVVVMLLAANLLFFAWSHWVSDNRSRLTAVTTTASRPAPPPAGPAAPPLCATIGPFTSELLTEQASQKLQAAGWGVAPRTVTQQVNEGWWVHVANTSGAAQIRTLNAIRRAGISDAFAMPDDPEFTVSVGIFSEEARAEDRAARVQRLQLDARVSARSRQQQETWFDISGVARETLSDGRLAPTGLPLDRLRIEACPLPGAARLQTALESAPGPAP